MSATVTIADPAEDHRAAVARHQELADKAAAAHRAVRDAEQARRDVLLAASDGKATVKGLAASDTALANARRAAEIAEVGAGAARLAAERAEIVKLHAEADAISDQIDGCNRDIAAALESLQTAVTAGRAALARLNDAAFLADIATNSARTFSEAVKHAATVNGTLGRTSVDAWPRIRQPATFRLDADLRRAGVEVVDKAMGDNGVINLDRYAANWRRITAPAGA